MNAFPLIFARTRAPAQLSRIRDSFCANGLTESTVAETSPKPVRLKRPGTSLKRTLHGTRDISDLTAFPPSPDMTSTDLLCTHTAKRLSKAGHFLSKVPCVRGKSIGPPVRSSRLRSSPVTTQSPAAVLNLETEPAMSDFETSSFQRLSILRAKSAEHRHAVHDRNDSDQWDVSVTDLEPCRNGPAADWERRKEHSFTSIVVGAAQLPARLAEQVYFEKVFGEPIRDAEKHKVLVLFLESALGVSFAGTSYLRFAQHPDTQEISIVATGQKAPISRCCKAAVVFSCSRTLGGKVLCTASYCPTRTICNFHIPIDLKDRVWNETVDQGPSLTSWELSVHVRKGSYKVVSLRREMTKRGKSTSEGYRYRHKKCLFSNERLKNVSPGPSKVAAVHLPMCLQASPIRLPEKVTGSPLHTLLRRNPSRHPQLQTPVELMAHLTCLLQV